MANYERDGVGAVIENAWESSLTAIPGKLWNGIRPFTAGSFAKWALITAGVILAGAALIGGLGAAAGRIDLMMQAGYGFVPIAKASIGQGIMFGLGEAAHFLLNPLGWLTLGGLGTAGAVADTNKAQGRISAMQAEQLAMQYELSRTRAMRQQQQMQPDEIPADGHAAAVKARRQAPGMNKQAQAV